MTHSTLRLLGTTAALLLTASTAMAGGFALREQSAKGQGSSFAGVAAGSAGLSSLFWNPAVSSEYNEFGFISESNASLILPYSESDTPAPGSGNIGEWAVVPASAYSYALTDQMTLGLTFGAPFGLTTNADNNWPGAIHGDKSAVKTYNLGPSVSYAFNDWLAIGVGAQIEYMTLDVTSRSGGVTILDIAADDLAAGFTAGVLLKPTDSTEIGLGFRSSIHHKLEGDGFSPFHAAGTPMSGKFDSPEIVTLGIRQAVSENLSLLAGVEWANWSRFKELRIVAPGPDLVTPEDWKDSWYFSLGGEYAYSDALTLRAGAAYEKSPVPDATRTPRVPDNDRFWLSAGASYKINDTMTAHMAYSHVFMDDGDINLPASPPLPALTASFDQHIDIVSVGLTKDW